MKGMSQTLYIVVAAVVILVAALVIITIFGSTIARFSTLSEAQSYCNNIAIPICSVSGDDKAVKSQLNNIKLEIGGQQSNCANAASQGNCNCDQQTKKWQCGTAPPG